MSEKLRELTIEDKEQVDLLCETIWQGNDYVPEIFSNWVVFPGSHTLGLFIDDELVAIGNIEKTENTNVAWIQGLRVRDTYRERGYATKVTKALTKIAGEMGIEILWYATSSRNAASMKVARKAGFYEAANTGYFRLYEPYPPHSKPSLSIVPVQVNPERLYELLTINPNLVDGNKFPLAWYFDYKTVEGLSRLLSKAMIRVVIDEAGIPQAVYCKTERERKDERTTAFSVFATDRAVFVDIMSRMIDEAEISGADRAV
ncbi:MAG: GNAT family N-acetyltransferase, partial [Candidatus Thorarchaeota archaeon]